MKICSVCQRCYEDAVTFCLKVDGGDLIASRSGNRKIAAKYRLDVLLERNATGDTYQASDINLDKSFVIKLVPLNLFGDPQQLLERLNDVKTAATINHPSVIGVYDYGTSDDDEFYIVTETVDGQLLRERLNSVGSLPEATAVIIARQTAEGLEAIHAAGIIHRSLNPANIILIGDPDRPSIKIQNFDYGGIFQQIVTTDIAAAAPYFEAFRYLSPEQCARRTVDARTDIYSFGVVLYETLNGRLPYDAQTPTELVYKQVNEQPLPLKQLSFDLRALLTHTLMWSLNKNPASRPQTAASVARHLRHLEYITRQSPIISQKPIANSLPTIKPDTAPINTFENALTLAVADDSFVKENQLFETPIVKTAAVANAVNFSAFEESIEENKLIEISPVFAEPIRVQEKIDVVEFLSEPILVEKKVVTASSFGSLPIFVKRKESSNIAPTTTQPIVLSPMTNVEEMRSRATTPVAANVSRIDQTRRRASLATLPLLVGVVAVLATALILGALFFNRQIQQPQTESSTAAIPPLAPVSAPEEQPSVATDNAPIAITNSNSSKVEVTSTSIAKPPPVVSERENNKSQPREGNLTNDPKTMQTAASEKKSESEKPSPAIVETSTQNQPRETAKVSDSQAELSASLDKLITATNARDVDQQMNYYAPKVNSYYRSRNTSQAAVRAEKKRVFDNADIDIQTGKPEIAVSSDGQSAKMRFRKKYVIKKGRQNRSGEVVQELQWVKSGKDWKIVSERDVKVINR